MVVEGQKTKLANNESKQTTKEIMLKIAEKGFSLNGCCVVATCPHRCLWNILFCSLAVFSFLTSKNYRAVAAVVSRQKPKPWLQLEPTEKQIEKQARLEQLDNTPDYKEATWT